MTTVSTAEGVEGASILHDSTVRIPVLDGWRGLAILVVVLHNGASAMPADGSLISTLTRSALAAGWVGVTIFFVLSGFLITGILVDTRGTPRFLRNFFVRRTLRIFPLYYVTLVTVFLIAPALVGPGEWTTSVSRHQLWFWTYLQNWTLWEAGISGMGHFWSLAVEEQFYLVWPFVVLVAGRKLPYVIAAVVLGSFLARLGMQWMGLPGEALYQSTVARADALAIGSLLALVVRQESLRLRLSVWRPWLLLAAIVALAVVVLSTEGLESKDPVVLVYGQSIVAVLSGLLVYGTLVSGTSWERRLAVTLSPAPLKSLGKYSYAIYVFHLPCHVLLLPYVRPPLENIGPFSRALLVLLYGCLLLALSLVLAVASWHLLERRALRLKDRWAPRPSQSPHP